MTATRRLRVSTAACWLSLVVAAVGLAACYHPRNPRLSGYQRDAGYTFKNLGSPEEQRAQNETFVILTFSGGGTRAAAFAYGALQALRETDIGHGRTLLDEVDVISSVSGGSFAAAYLGLFGQEAFFKDFPDVVLHRRLESGIIWSLVNPLHWPELLSPSIGRSDLADRYYDTHVFQRRRFSDLPRHRPFIILNATDIDRGAQFSFTQDSFDRLCSDLDPVPVSGGVTASSAFPVAFTPLTLKNYGPSTCQYEPPPWVANALKGDFNANPQRYDLAQTWKSYEDVQRRPFIHLSDGGLADNIGLRAIETGIMSTGSLGVLNKVDLGEIKRLIVIVVDAKPRDDSGIDRSPRPPSIYTVLNAAATNPMENYSSDTVERIRLLFQGWDRDACDFQDARASCDAFAAKRCPGASRACRATQRTRCYALAHAGDDDRPPHPALYLMHVRFDAIPDRAVKERLEKVDTRLQLPADQVDLLVKWGNRLVTKSCTYEQLVRDIRGDGPPRDPCQQSVPETTCYDF